MEAHTKSLVAVFRVLPKLDSIRILTVDPAFHLGGWLQPGDEDLLSKDHTFFQDRSSEALIQHYNRNTHSRMYTNESAMIKDCIIDAIKLSSLKLRDFRATPKPTVFDLDTAPFIKPALQTLRIVLADGDMERQHIFDFVKTLTERRDLSLFLKDKPKDQSDMSPQA